MMIDDHLNRYCVTVLIDGHEFSIPVRAVDEDEAAQKGALELYEPYWDDIEVESVEKI